MAAIGLTKGRGSTSSRFWPQRYPLLVKFLTILTPLFLVLSAPRIGFLVHLELRQDQEVLAARIGNQAARIAVALGRYDLASMPRLGPDLLAPLASDRAFLCAEVRKGEGDPIAALPPGLGCRGAEIDQTLTLPAGPGQRLTIRYTDAELKDGWFLAVTLALSVVGLAFFFAIIASVVGFRLIVGRPLRALLSAIRLNAESGERRAVGLQTRDELGTVIKAYDAMVQHEAEREAALSLANEALSASERNLKELNHALEKRVRDRTADLDAQRKLAEAASEAKSRFLAMMGHELRTPLNAIIGFSEIMKSQLLGPLGTPQYVDYSEEVHGSGMKLLGINDVLTLSKVESDAQALKSSSVEADLLIRECFAAIASTASKSGIELVDRATGRGTTLSLDANKFKRALIALLDNAVKFTPAGGRAELRLEAAPQGGIAFVVADTGRGMTPEEIPIAMSLFGQVDDSLTRQYEGSGLGLPLAKLLTELHGGSLVIESTPGQGTIVRVLLPKDRVISAGNPV